MQDNINYLYKKFLKNIAKWFAIFVLCIFVGLTLSAKFIAPKFDPQKKEGATKMMTIPGGGKQLVYGEKDTPKTYEEAMDKTAPQIILQNQKRFYDDFSHTDHEDLKLTKDAPKETLRQLALVSREFLDEWETFNVYDSEDSYTQRIQDYVTIDGLPSISTRKDNLQDKSIGIGKESGSQFLRPDLFITSDTIKLLDYNSEEAYISVTGKVLYTGPLALWQGQEYRRSYSLLLKRENGEWKVNRAVAETLGESN